MAADGSVVFATELDQSGLKSGLKNLAGLGGKFAKGFGAAIAGVSAAFLGLAKVGLQYNSQMENYQTNFSVLLGDEAAALDYVAQMREKAAKTPFGMEDLASASQTMLSFGINAEDSMKYMDMLGDIALGNKEKLGTLSLAFSQISSAGKLTGQDLLQLINAGFNPLQTIADKTGASVGDLKDVMAGGKGSKEFQKLVKDAQKEVARLGDNASESSKMLAQIGDEGMISADMVGQAMEIETSEGGRFYQGMLKASKTMSGIISTLKDDAMALVGNVFAPLSASIAENVLPLVSGYLSSLTNAFEKGGTEGLINRLGTVIADIFIKAADALPGVIDIATNILTTIVKSITRVAPRLAKSAASALSSLISGAAKALPDIAGALYSLLGNAFEALGEEAPAIVESVIVGIMDALIAMLENAPQYFRGGMKLISGLLQGILAALPIFGEKLVEYFDTYMASFVELLPELLAFPVNLIIDMINGLFATNIPKISKIELPTWDEIKQTFIDWWNVIKPNLQNLFSLDVLLGRTDAAGNPIDPLAYYEEKHQWLKENSGNSATAGPIPNLPWGNNSRSMSSYTRSVSQMAAQTRDKVRAQLEQDSTAFSQIGSDIAQYMAQGVSESAAEFVESLSSSIESSGARMRESGLSLAESIADGTLMGEGIVANAFSELLTETKSDALSRVREFEEVGYQIPAGVAQGVERGQSILTQAIERMVDDALRAARNRAQIQSPSRLFENEFGGYLPAGAARGVDKNSHLLQASVQRMVDSSLPDMANFGAGLGSWERFRQVTAGAMVVNQDINFNVPVQTPDEFAQMLHQYSTFGLAGEG